MFNDCFYLIRNFVFFSGWYYVCCWRWLLQIKSVQSKNWNGFTSSFPYQSGNFCLSLVAPAMLELKSLNRNRKNELFWNKNVIYCHKRSLMKWKRLAKWKHSLKISQKSILLSLKIYDLNVTLDKDYLVPLYLFGFWPLTLSPS